MVVVNLIGGLGNQMFQYAAARSIAIERNQTLFINTEAFKNYKLHDLGLYHFHIKSKLYKEQPKLIRKIGNKIGLNYYYKETSFRYDSSLFNNNSRNLYLSGYFQSENYFKKHRNIILEEFKITSPLKQLTNLFLEDISKVNSVSIHIRRGDFLEHAVHNTSKKEYYRKAMEYIEGKVNNIKYYLFSDDMDWVKSNFNTNFEAIYVDFNDTSTAYEDLMLMSHCKHNIIANSSFSWWGAWLNTNSNKTIIAPKLWFNGNMYDYTDVVPDSWIKI